MAASRGTAAGCPEVRWPMRSVRCPCSYDPKDAQQRTPGGARDLPEVSVARGSWFSRTSRDDRRDRREALGPFLTVLLPMLLPSLAL